MNEAYIKEVFSDEAFVKSFLELETPEEVQAALKEKNIDVTEDEIIALRDNIVKLAQKAEAGEELSPEQLDEAAGGLFLTFTASIIMAVAVVGTVATVGAAVGAGVGAGAVIGLSKLIGNRRW